MAGCLASFPCLVNIFVLAGVEAPCQNCAGSLDKMRELDGYVKYGGFYRSTMLNSVCP